MFELTNRKKDILEELRTAVSDLCDETNVPEPGVFLAEIMSGRDPRNQCSKLYKFVKSLAESDEEPNEIDFEYIKFLVLGVPPLFISQYEPERVDINQSIKAAEKLIEYLHAKLKAVEVSGNVAVEHRVVPLTDDEAKVFLKRWNKEF